jgi:hypothetical protein
MSETRPPEAMPTDWTVASFAHEKASGTLRHAAGEEVVFDIDAWDLGNWKPSGKDAAVIGTGSPLLPQPGEPVHVKWRRSATGKNVPRVVQPTGRVSVERQEYKLGAWLKAVQKHGGRFSGLTPATLLKALARLDEDRADEWKDGQPREAWEYAFLLMNLAHLADDDSHWRTAHAGWIYADDHRWDRDHARHRLPAMLGLSADAVPTAGDGYNTGADESLPEYAAKCNAAAVAAGVELRLHEVDLEGDEHVFVCLPQRGFDALTRGGYLVPAG